MYLERDVIMKLKKFIAPLLVGVLAFAIAGCGTNTNQSSQTPKEIKIGAHYLRRWICCAQWSD